MNGQNVSSDYLLRLKALEISATQSDGLDDPHEVIKAGRLYYDFLRGDAPTMPAAPNDQPPAPLDWPIDTKELGYDFLSEVCAVATAAQDAWDKGQLRTTGELALEVKSKITRLAGEHLKASTRKEATKP